MCELLHKCLYAASIRSGGQFPNGTSRSTKPAGIAHQAWPTIPHRSMPPIVRAHQAPEVGQPDREALMIAHPFHHSDFMSGCVGAFLVLQASAQTTPDFVNENATK
jgi:hypothetical protein